MTFILREKITVLLCALFFPSFLWADQTVVIDGNGPARRFDGIGAVSGGGGTSVLLKDYPEPQRQQILDLLFKPSFGASISALYVEIGGDGNSTQGSELSHMHTRDDENYNRGYEAWLMKEAKNRNPNLSLDSCGWSCPGWITDFYSQDMCDYYAKWIKGLQTSHGLTMDAIGCRNESGGVHEDFVKMLRRTLDANGLNHVVIHGFDNWAPAVRWKWVSDLQTDPELRAAIGVLSNHTLSNVVVQHGPVPDSVKQISLEMDKPIWDTEEHVYDNRVHLDEYDCEIKTVKSFNLNFIDAGATKIVNWYLVDSYYGVESYKTTPAVMIADSPWSGHYSIRDTLWGYAHYGQFSKIGWQYLTQACGRLTNGGTYVTMKSPGDDYSVIAETSGASAVQTVTFKLGAGVSKRKLCVWRSNRQEQFVRQPDATPVDGSYTMTFEPESIYSISTTTGQQKGSFDNVPAEQPFPFPYRDTFSRYIPAKAWGYLPHYTADISGAFELEDRPDGKGLCLKQITPVRAQVWGREWKPLTILGDLNWTDYEVSCDVLLDDGAGTAGIMGRIHSSGDGGSFPVAKGYYLALSSNGDWALYSTIHGKKEGPSGKKLAGGTTSNFDPKAWHNLKLRFAGTTISAAVDGTDVGSIINEDFAKGLVGLIADNPSAVPTKASFSNLIIKPLNAPVPAETVFGASRLPLYPGSLK